MGRGPHFVVQEAADVPELDVGERPQAVEGWAFLIDRRGGVKLAKNIVGWKNTGDWRPP